MLELVDDPAVVKELKLVVDFLLQQDRDKDFMFAELFHDNAQCKNSLRAKN